jgi:hypothetical protein
MADQMPHGLGNLGGEADPNSWHFLAPHGPVPNAVGHTFPLLTHDATGSWRLIGAGFYVSGDGLFVTAKHVIEDVLDGDQQVLPLAIMHLRSESGLFGPQEYLLRPIMQCWLGESADVALGAAAFATNRATGDVLSHWSWPLSWTTPALGTVGATYAFPNHSITQTESGQFFRFRPDLYRGTIREVGDFRDRVLVPYPYMHVDFRIHHAASAGPVLSAEGAVVGVNCRFMDPAGPGVVAQIRCLQDAFLEDVVLLGETAPRRVAFGELVSAGAVTARQFAPAVVAHQPGRVVRLDTVKTSARGPGLEMDVYS